jgi:hypothetical protein
MIGTSKLEPKNRCEMNYLWLVMTISRLEEQVLLKAFKKLSEILLLGQIFFSSSIILK